MFTKLFQFQDKVISLSLLFLATSMFAQENFTLVDKTPAGTFTQIDSLGIYNSKQLLTMSDASSIAKFYEWDGDVTFTDKTPAGTFSKMKSLSIYNGKRQMAFTIQSTSLTGFYEYDGTTVTNKTPVGSWTDIQYLSVYGGKKLLAFQYAVGTVSGYKLYQYDGTSLNNVTPTVTGFWSGIYATGTVSGFQILDLKDNSSNQRIFRYNSTTFSDVTPSGSWSGITGSTFDVNNNKLQMVLYSVSGVSRLLEYSGSSYTDITPAGSWSSIVQLGYKQNIQLIYFQDKATSYGYFYTYDSNTFTDISPSPSTTYSSINTLTAIEPLGNVNVIVPFYGSSVYQFDGSSFSVLTVISGVTGSLGIYNHTLQLKKSYTALLYDYNGSVVYNQTVAGSWLDIASLGVFNNSKLLKFQTFGSYKLYAYTSLADQRINNFPVLNSNYTYGAASISLANVTATSGLPIVFSSTNSNVISVAGNNLIFGIPGTTTITATQVGGTDYESAVISYIVTIDKLTQSVIVPSSFPVMATYMNTPYSLSNFSSTSGLPLTYSSTNPNVVSIAGGKLYFIGAGQAEIDITLAGNAYYTASGDTKFITVNKADQTISGLNALQSSYGIADNNIDLIGISASSGLPVSFNSSNPGVLSVVGNQLKILNYGTSLITAFQNGTNNYNPTSTSYVIGISSTITGQVVTVTAPPVTVTVTTTVVGTCPPSSTVIGVSLLTEVQSAYPGALIYIYPNPTQGKVNIQTVNVSLGSIEVFNSIGVSVLKLDGQAEVDLTSSPIGLYSIWFKDKNGILIAGYKILRE